MRGCVVFGQTVFFQLHQNSEAPCVMFYYADIPIKTTSDHFTIPPTGGITSRIQSFTIYVYSTSRRAWVFSQNMKLLTCSRCLKALVF